MIAVSTWNNVFSVEDIALETDIVAMTPVVVGQHLPDNSYRSRIKKWTSYFSAVFYVPDLIKLSSLQAGHLSSSPILISTKPV